MVVTATGGCYMKVKDLTERIEREIPKDAALDWDNVGLLVGDEEQQIHKVYLALDLTDEVLEHGIRQGVDMILTHHPLLFSGVKRINTSDFMGRRIRGLIQENISYYAMHTNFDVCVMGMLAAEYLDLQDVSVLDVVRSQPEPQGIGCVGQLKETVELEPLAQVIKDRFSISHVRVFGDPGKKVRTVAVCPGSGKSDVAEALRQKADVYITGDIDHHTGIDAAAEGMAVIDAGHYGIEHIYMDYMKNWLQRELPELEVICEPLREPFWIV